MTVEALRGIARMGTEKMFLPAWWFEPFDLSMRDFLASVEFRTLVGNLRPAVTCSLNRTNKPFPMAEDEPEGLLTVAPSARCGLAVLLRPTTQANEIVSLWPFVTEGQQHDDMTIDEVVLAPNRLEAMVTGSLPSGLQLVWHDLFFATDRAFYAEGSVHSAILAGLVHQLTPVQDTPIEIPADNPAWSAVRAHSSEGFNPDGSITIQTRGMAIAFPASGDSPEFYALQGPVRRVQPNFTEMFGRPVHLVTVAIMRDPDAELPLYITDSVLDGRPLPGVGDDFGAAARIVGRIWIPNVQTAGER